LASLRQAILAAAAGTVLLVSAVIYLSDTFSNDAALHVGESELSIAQAAAQYIKSNATASSNHASSISINVNGSQIDVKNKHYTNALTVGDLIAANAIQSGAAKLSNGATPQIIIRNENGGVAILVTSDPYSLFKKANVGTVLGADPWFGEIAQNADANNAHANLISFGGAWQSQASHYGLSSPENQDYFAPVAMQWISSANIQQAAQTAATAGGAIANLKPGQSYTDSQGQTFTAYSSSQGVVIYTAVPDGYLWFPQSAFSESTPSLNNFYVPSGTGTHDTGEGPYSLVTSGNTVNGYWDGQQQGTFPLSDF
jgi:ribosomal protein L18